jgi:hypothetical protein
MLKALKKIFVTVYVSDGREQLAAWAAIAWENAQLIKALRADNAKLRLALNTAVRERNEAQRLGERVMELNKSTFGYERCFK